jgi:hypothetical protein
MTASYSFRPSVISKEEAFTLDDKGLVISDRGTIAFSEIRQIRTYEYPGVTMGAGAPVAPGAKRCVIKLHHGRSVILVSNHFVAPGKFEDKSATYDPFIAALIPAVGAGNAQTVFISGMPAALWIGWIMIVGAAFLIVPLLIIAMIGMIMDGKSISAGMFFSGLILLGVVIGVRPLVRMLRRNWPHRYDPRAASKTA